MAGLWLTGEVVNHVGIYLDLRRPRVYRRSNIRTYKRKYWLYLSLPIYWSTGVFFASKYFSKTDKLCEKFNPVACFTHALPDHRQQHPNEFFSHIYWDQGWGQLHNINSTPTPTPEVSTPTPTPANLQNINSNSNSGGFNSNSNSNSGKSPEYQLQLQLQLQLRRFQLQLQFQLRQISRILTPTPTPTPEFQIHPNSISNPINLVQLNNH